MTLQEREIYMSQNKYELPDEIIALITDDFLKEFRSQLFRIHKNYDLRLFAEDGIPANTSTNGWYSALKNACNLTNKEYLLKYWSLLNWMDAYIFDIELAKILIDRKFILGKSSDIKQENIPEKDFIAKQLNIDPNNLFYCDNCGGLYTNEMIVKVENLDEKDESEKHICLCCQDTLTAVNNESNQ